MPRRKEQEKNIFFSHYPLLLLMDNDYSLVWKSKWTFFVYITGIGLRRNSGMQYVENTENLHSYELRAFTLFGIKRKQLILDYTVVSKSDAIPKFNSIHSKATIHKLNTKPQVASPKKVEFKAPTSLLNISFKKGYMNEASALLKKVRSVKNQEELEKVKRETIN